MHMYIWLHSDSMLNVQARPSCIRAAHAHVYVGAGIVDVDVG